MPRTTLEFDERTTITNLGLMKTFLSLAGCLGASFLATAQIRTESVEYKQGDAILEGFLAHDASIKGKRPGVLVVHQWRGLSDYEKKRADMLANKGVDRALGRI